VVHGDLCLVQSRKAGRSRTQLFDLSRDPGQREEIPPADGSPGPAGDARERLGAILAAAFAAMGGDALPREARAFDAETRRALEGLGYAGK
jgi:hypothetical protein